MSEQNKTKEQGLSLRTTSLLMLGVSVAVTVVLLIVTIGTFRAFLDLEKTTDDYISMQDAATELMNASDYLTEEVQCYTVIGDRQHMDNYFTEAEKTRRREHAIAVMEESKPGSAALEDLVQGMNESVSLMDREYYAMRLVMEAQGDQDYPQALKNITLSRADSSLTPEEKIKLAQSMVHDEAYYAQKNRIRESMADCIRTLKDETHGTQQGMEDRVRRDLSWTVVLIAIQSLAVFLLLWLITHLGINPVLRAVDHIKMDRELPIVGASEFRYLAGTYNKMYTAYKKSIENLSFKASHDELTGVYNRAGYDLIKSSLDMTSTALLLFDADTFKQVNDEFGHEQGDKVLQKIASTLKKNFRSDDYICRIGGDEFVVFMVHVNQNPEALIERKVRRINRELSNGADDLPPITLSVGVSFNEKGEDPSVMFRQADIALYYVKEHGRDGCCFWTDALKGKTKPETDY